MPSLSESSSAARAWLHVGFSGTMRTIISGSLGTLVVCPDGIFNATATDSGYSRLSIGGKQEHRAEWRNATLRLFTSCSKLHLVVLYC